MIKKLSTLIALIVTAPSFAQTELAVPMFTDVQIQITDNNKQIYLADVLIPRNQEVIENGLKAFVPKSICDKTHTIVDLEFQEGIRLALTAQTTTKMGAFIQADYIIATSKNEGLKDFGVGCKREDITTNTIHSNPTFHLKTGEVMSLETGGRMKISITAKGIYNTAPEGKAPGVFYHHN